jgi:hypothetical protein
MVSIVMARIVIASVAKQSRRAAGLGCFFASGSSQ